jgi:hypothetical protein
MRVLMSFKKMKRAETTGHPIFEQEGERWRYLPVACHVYERLLMAYIKAAGEFCEAATNLSDATGKPFFPESLQRTNQARIKCTTALRAMRYHRFEHRCQEHISSPEGALLSQPRATASE